jgi:phage repressor protein C with HTH and peptisase S24 domain
MTSFPDILKQWRQKARLSQGQLADLAGTTTALISRYEKGHVAPRIETVEKLAAALNAPTELFLVALSGVNSIITVRFINEDREIQLDERYLPPIPEQIKLFATHIRGYSMQPTLSDSDIVIVDQSLKQITNDEIFAFNFDDETIIKRIRLTFGAIALVSDNPDKMRYPDILVPNGVNLAVLGKVIWRCGLAL